MKNKEVYLKLLFMYNGVVSSKKIDGEITKEVIEQHYKNYIQEEIDDLIKRSSYTIAVRYKDEKGCNTFERFQKDQLQEALEFLNEKKKDG